MQNKTWITKSGLTAKALFVQNSHYCGYVGVPQGHVLYGRKYGEDIPELKPLFQKMLDKSLDLEKTSILRVFSYGLGDHKTSMDLVLSVHGGVTYADSDPLKEDKMWWIGFDCAHCDDKTSFNPNGVFRTLEYVMRECEDLAEQITSLA